jgi:hypothetical protein
MIDRSLKAYRELCWLFLSVGGLLAYLQHITGSSLLTIAFAILAVIQLDTMCRVRKTHRAWKQANDALERLKQFEEKEKDPEQ